MVAAHPVEALLLDVRMLLVVDEVLAVSRSDRIAGAVLDGLVRQHFLGWLVLMGKLPRCAVSRRVVLDVLHVAATFEDEGFETFLAKFLSSPAAGNARADDDGVEGVVGLAFHIHVHGFWMLDRIGLLAGLEIGGRIPAAGHEDEIEGLGAAYFGIYIGELRQLLELPDKSCLVVGLLGRAFHRG